MRLGAPTPSPTRRGVVSLTCDCQSYLDTRLQVQIEALKAKYHTSDGGGPSLRLAVLKCLSISASRIAYSRTHLRCTPSVTRVKTFNGRG
jgi:hypothetical protein